MTQILNDIIRRELANCYQNAILKIGTNMPNLYKEGFGKNTEEEIKTIGGHEVHDISIDAERDLDKEVQKEIKRLDLKKYGLDGIPILTETTDLITNLSNKFPSLDKAVFCLSDCPDGSSLLKRFAFSSMFQLPGNHSPEASINLTLYEGGVKFENITTNINYTMAGDLTVAMKHDSGLVDILFRDSATGNMILIDPDRLMLPAERYKGSAFAQIMTNDNLGTDRISSLLREKLLDSPFKLVRYASSGSSILDQHKALFYCAADAMIDPRGFTPLDGPVLHPVEAASNLLAFERLGWDTYFVPVYKGSDFKMRPMKEFDLGNEELTTTGEDGGLQYNMVGVWLRRDLGKNIGYIKKKISDCFKTFVNEQSAKGVSLYVRD